MPIKPMTDYLNYKYPVAEKPINSVLTQVNEILTRVSNIERELSEMRNTANNIGKDYLEHPPHRSSGGNLRFAHPL